MAKEILLLGEFSTGKSAFVNMLLGVSVLPERLESTDFPVVKIHGHKPTGIFLREKGQKNPAILDNWKDIPSDWTIFDYAEMTIPNHELLSLGLIIWDTPGFNSKNHHHMFHLDNFLLYGHHNFQHIFFFVRGNITKVSLDMLKKYKFANEKVTVVVNIHSNTTLEENKRMFSNVNKVLADHGFNYKSIMLSIGDICEEFNEIAASALQGERLSDWELIKQWDKRKVNINSLLDKFSAHTFGTELFTVISETAQMQEKDETFYKKLPMSILKEYADKGNAIAQYLYGENQLLNLYVLDAIRYYDMSAKNGYGPAQYVMASFYKNGCKNDFTTICYLEKDESKFNSYLHLAMRNNNPHAIAESYFEGVGCEKNPQTGFSILLAAWNNGDAKVLERIAECYRYGQGVEGSIQLAEKFYRLAAENDFLNNFSLGEFLLGLDNIEKRNEGISILSKLSDKCFLAGVALIGDFLNSESDIDGRTLFQWLLNYQRTDGIVPYLLAKFYLTGRGIEQNLEKGFEYLKKAYSIDGSGYFLLAECYRNGIGCKANNNEAIKIYRDILKGGDPIAKRGLGVLLLEDEEKSEEGLHLITEAAESGVPEAIRDLVEIYKDGNPELALRWLKKLAFTNDAETNALFGEVYKLNGLHREAVKYLEEAMWLGDAEATNSLGLCAFNGLGMPKNERQAFKFFESAAGKGLPIGMYNLSMMYYDGTGVTKNIKLSNEWCLKAAESGSDSALLTMGIRYLDGTDIQKNEEKAFQFFETLAERNDPNGYLWLGLMYYQGIHVDRDLFKSLAYVKMAHDSGLRDGVELLSEIKEELKKGPYARWKKTKDNSYYFEINGESLASKTENKEIFDSMIVFYPDDNLYFLCIDYANKPVDHWHEAEFLGDEEMVFYAEENSESNSISIRLIDFQHPIDWSKTKKYRLGDHFIIQSGFWSYVVFNDREIENKKIYHVHRFEIKWKKDKENSFYLMLDDEYLSGERITDNFMVENDLICEVSDLQFKVNLMNFKNEKIETWHPAIFSTADKGFLRELADIFLS